MALYLERKTSLSANVLSLKEATRHQVYRHGRAQGSDRDRCAKRQWPAVIESIVETKASSILQFIHGLRGELHVTWEEGKWAACLYDLLQPQVTRVLVSDPRRNALLKEGNQSDKVDARKLADLLRTGMLRPVYHREHGLRMLRELGRSYQTISQDLNRAMNRIKALHRGWSIPCAGTQVYALRYREGWLHKIEHVGVRQQRRAALSAVGWIAEVTTNPASRVIGGERKTQSHETTTSDSLHRSDPSRPLNRVDADAAPVP
jgi:transposase